MGDFSSSVKGLKIFECLFILLPLSFVVKVHCNARVAKNGKHVSFTVKILRIIIVLDFFPRNVNVFFVALAFGNIYSKTH